MRVAKRMSSIRYATKQCQKETNITLLLLACSKNKEVLFFRLNESHC